MLQGLGVLFAVFLFPGSALGIELLVDTNPPPIMRLSCGEYLAVGKQTLQDFAKVRTKADWRAVGGNAGLWQTVRARFERATTFANYMGLLQELGELQEAFDKNRSNVLFLREKIPQVLEIVDIAAPLVKMRSLLSPDQIESILVKLAILMKAGPRPHDPLTVPINELFYNPTLISFKTLELIFFPDRARKQLQNYIRNQEVFIWNAGIWIYRHEKDFDPALVHRYPYLPLYVRTVFDSLPENLRGELEDYLRSQIDQGRRKMRTLKAQGLKDEDGYYIAMRQRRNAEVFLTILERDSFFKLVEKIRDLPDNNFEQGLGRLIESAWNERNGEASELSFSRIFSAAHRIQEFLAKNFPTEKVYWVGSGPNGGFDLKKSDMDLIPTKPMIEMLRREFGADDQDRHFDLDKPRNRNGRKHAELFKALEQAVLKEDFGQRQVRSLFSLEGGGMSREPKDWDWLHTLLFKFGGLNQTMTVQISATGVSLILYDANTFTMYEIKL